MSKSAGSFSNLLSISCSSASNFPSRLVDKDFTKRPEIPAAGSARPSKATSLQFISSPAAREPKASPEAPKEPSTVYSAISAATFLAPVLATPLATAPPRPADKASKEPTIPALAADSFTNGAISSSLFHAASRALGLVISIPFSAILPSRVLPKVSIPEPANAAPATPPAVAVTGAKTVPTAAPAAAPALAEAAASGDIDESTNPIRDSGIVLTMSSRKLPTTFSSSPASQSSAFGALSLSTLL